MGGGSVRAWSWIEVSVDLIFLYFSFAPPPPPPPPPPNPHQNTTHPPPAHPPPRYPNLFRGRDSRGSSSTGVARVERFFPLSSRSVERSTQRLGPQIRPTGVGQHETVQLQIQRAWVVARALPPPSTSLLTWPGQFRTAARAERCHPTPLCRHPNAGYLD